MTEVFETALAVIVVTFYGYLALWYFTLLWTDLWTDNDVPQAPSRSRPAARPPFGRWRGPPSLRP